MSASELADLNGNDQTYGACPAGWRLPTYAELSALSAMAEDVDNEDGFAGLDNGAGQTINFNVNFLGYRDVANGTVSGADAYFWSDTEVGGNESNQAYGLVISSMDESGVRATNKAYAFTIRCVKDEP
jgi:uncharacterized protein (TIGR02145 family)